MFRSRIVERPQCGKVSSRYTVIHAERLRLWIEQSRLGAYGGTWWHFRQVVTGGRRTDEAGQLLQTPTCTGAM